MRPLLVIGTLLASPIIVYAVGLAMLSFAAVAIAFAPIGFAGRVARLW